jgi:hypothetical protein
MGTHEAIDILSDIIESLDEVIAQSLLLDTGQAQMVTEARQRINQVQTELIEFNLSEDDAEAERLSDEWMAEQDGCPND